MTEKKLKDIAKSTSGAEGMPSTRNSPDDYEDMDDGAQSRRTALVPSVQQPYKRSIVSYEQWLENEEDYLLNIYHTIQEMNASTGRCAFDTETCDFETFCRIAYDYSFKYQKRERHLYESDNGENHLENTNPLTYVFE